ncbi:MAG TPA: type I-PGING CRISPR-associated protein Cas8c/Csp2 [Niabella sp.]|nr:type I-PGING CRISPR-associated protein Cas8c/Csp2 [Niabella sp.]HUN02401.1 type I-PGING CRISPR-associated protein Cas8c/Csp2 [Niabella sp.]
MSTQTHPFINYGTAIVLVRNNLANPDAITRQHLIAEIENGINHFRVKPDSVITNQASVKFIYCDEESGNPSKGIYLSSSILSTDKNAKKVFATLKKIKTDLEKTTPQSIGITKLIAPVSGEYGNFGENSISRGKPKTTLEIASLCLITKTTHKKPAIAFKTYKKAKAEIENLAILPDLSIPELADFINLFEQMRLQSTTALMVGNVNQDDKKPFRPKIFDGNFPNAPRSNALGVVGLLGAIGAWAKDAAMISWANKVLDSLKDRPIYVVGTKTFDTYTYNHYIIELAKENKLNSIIDSIYYTVLFNQGYRNSKNRIQYQNYDMFVSRFLQLFNPPSFKDFLSFRAEYPYQLETLFKTYFINMEKISEAVVQSARELGKWLNYAAYRVANSNIDENTQERDKKVREQKAKSLIEIESSIFSARSGDALIFQAITRAGRASGLDAPAEAELFMTQASTGEISLESAKHLLIAFSRVRNKWEPKPKNTESVATEESDDAESDDFSDVQE